jgi:hypothetical protein
MEREEYIREHPVYEFSEALGDLLRFSFSMARSFRDRNYSPLGEREFAAFRIMTFEEKALRVARGSMRLLWRAVDLTLDGAALVVYTADKL